MRSAEAVRDGQAGLGHPPWRGGGCGHPPLHFSRGGLKGSERPEAGCLGELGFWVEGLGFRY